MEIDDIKKKILTDVDPLEKEKKKKVRRRLLLTNIIEFAAIVIVIFVVFRFIIGMSPVEGNSMYPTLHDKNTVFYSRLTKTYTKGDIVAIERPNNEMFVKRVVAVAGDTVNIEGANLYINGKKQVEPYVLGETETEEGGIKLPVTVKDGEIFVLGDNRMNSEDSRMFGVIDIKDAKGKLLWYIGVLD